MNAILDFGKTAIGLHKLTANSIQQKGLDLKNSRGQGYGCAVVISGKYAGFRSNMWLHMRATCMVLRTI